MAVVGPGCTSFVLGVCGPGGTQEVSGSLVV
eukprot:CAMPEP_0115308638 /NCGR_PEP_ID=MMETSP0270-20121206/73808_1 /TAXON_ID=71861 /ORGANISM="Scrippsiella trochoidea, Strain CCMP3099" /LENGTH=30 /DNA_ID= /DNA_START= /DNA_END= /DNA_ORIENTATION=